MCVYIFTQSYLSLSFNLFFFLPIFLIHTYGCSTTPTHQRNTTKFQPTAIQVSGESLPLETNANRSTPAKLEKLEPIDYYKYFLAKFSRSNVISPDLMRFPLVLAKSHRFSSIISPKIFFVFQIYGSDQTNHHPLKA